MGSDSLIQQSQTPAVAVESLLRVVAGRAPFCVAKALLDENLASYMDGKLLSTGAVPWFGWVRFLHHTAEKRIIDLDISVDRIRTDITDAGVAVVRVSASWGGVIQGRLCTSNMGEIAYHVQNGKIREIHTHRKNYVFVYGPRFTNHLVFYGWLLRMVIWRML